MIIGPFALNLRHLRALSAIVAQGSMSAAAASVSLSQPALTQGVSKLERQLGTQLFDRRPDGMRPTAMGVAMADRAASAFAHLAAATHGAGRRGRGFARPDVLMTATQLRATLALADAGSFIGAAAATGLSQPALHRAVRELEQVCGVPIAERAGRGVILTPAGQKIARGVRLAALEISAGIIELAADPQNAGRIAVGAMPLCRALVLPHAIAAFSTGSPRAMLDIREGSWNELVDPLRAGSLDMMIGALRAEAPAGLDQQALFEDRLVVVARAGHPLAGAERLALADLRDFGWIAAQPGTPLHAHWQALFTDRPPPLPALECGSVMVIRGVLAATDLLTLLSPDQVALEIQSGMLTQIGPSLPQAVRTIGITTRTGWRPTAAQRRFAGLVADAAKATRVLENL